MPKTATITTRVDPELKNNAEHVFQQLGMNTTQAINMFLKQVELRQGLPFDVQVPQTLPVSKQRLAGLHKNSMEISKDFDEPLTDDFWLGEA